MPLKAIHDGKEIIGELMDYQEWKDLKKKVQDGSVKLTTACCGVECYARDRQGTRHFVHKHVGNCSTGKGETMEHLLLKARILRGCRNAGYEVDTEVDGDGWRADVLATKGKIKVAFEVQWSPQTYEETVERQKKYEDSNVRGVWLFRKMPDQTVSSTDVQLKRYIPMFQIDLETVEWDKFKRPMICGLDADTFAEELLRGNLKLCERIRLEPVQIIRLDIAETSCHRCHRNYHIVRFNSTQSPLVDVHGKKQHGWSDLFPDGVEYSSVVADALNTYARTAEGNKYKFGEIKPRYSHTEKKSYVSQGCPHCDALNGRFYLNMEWHELEVIGHVYLAIPIPENSTVKGKHWCHSEDKFFCPSE
jgi:hypothetical protein